MTPIKLAAAVLNQTPLAWDANRANIVAAIRAARDRGVAVLCLPELCTTGYGCEDAFLSDDLVRTAAEILIDVVPESQGLVVSLGLPVHYDGVLYNAAALAVDGQLVGLVGKQHLAGDGVHYEPRWFRPWPAGARERVELGGQSYPLGDFVFDCAGVRIGFEICEDAWVANRTGRGLAQRGVDILLGPSASHFAFGKQDVRRRLVVDGSREFGVAYLFANLLGNEAGRMIYDGGAMVAAAGEILAAGTRFSAADFQLTTAVVDVDALRRGRPVLATSAALDEGCIRTPINLPPHQETLPQAAPSAAELPDWETGPHRKEEEFARVVSLGLFDYLRKSHSHGFVVSLSGGVDSASVATLVALMVRLATAELGRDGFLAKLAHVDGLADAEDTRAIVGRLLTCVYQSTRNSSTTTRTAARGLAEALGADFVELDVDSTVENYVAMISRAVGRTLDWQTDDLALQNIQARARAPSVWLLANLRRALLLSTSNRSEGAVGYTTMDGDTSGGLAPIAGIDKAFLREWLRWMETTGPAGTAPIPALSAVNEQQPTAELRPPAAGQTDEDDLMPYVVLDAIERAAIRDKRAPLAVFRVVEPQFPDYPREQLGQWVEHFFTLWCRNQWKRERYAPSFHLDDENLDPKTWCRFPILSGGFERELEELRAVLSDDE